MLVRILGFNLEFEGKISAIDYYKHIEEDCMGEIDFNGYNRLIRLKRIDRYYLGLLVTIKDQKLFYKIRRDGGKFVISKHELEAGSKLMDFNFFVINPKNNTGLYQHYHQSCSASQFGVLLRKIFNNKREIIINQAIEELSKGERDEKDLHRLRRKYKSKLTFTVMVKRENFASLLAEFSRIKSFNFNFSTVFDEEPAFRPLRNEARKMRHHVTFKKEAQFDDIKRAIMKPIRDIDLSGVKVVCEDEDGIERVLKILDNPDKFAEYDYDDIASQMVLDIENFETTSMAINLNKLAERYLVQ